MGKYRNNDYPSNTAFPGGNGVKVENGLAVIEDDLDETVGRHLLGMGFSFEGKNSGTGKDVSIKPAQDAKVLTNKVEA